MHGPHAGHEHLAVKGPIRQMVDGVFAVPDRGGALRINRHILVAVKTPHFLERNPHRLGRHVSKIVGPKPLPAWLSGQIQRHPVHEPAGNQPDPGPPVEMHPGTEKGQSPLNHSPFAFM